MSSTKKKYDLKFYDEKPEVITLSRRKLIIKEAPDVYIPKTKVLSLVTKHTKPKQRTAPKLIDIK